MFFLYGTLEIWLFWQLFFFLFFLGLRCFYNLKGYIISCSGGTVISETQAHLCFDDKKGCTSCFFLEGNAVLKVLFLLL